MEGYAIWRKDYEVAREAEQVAREAVRRDATPGDLFTPAVPPDVDELSYLSGYWDGIRFETDVRYREIAERIMRQHQADLDYLFAKADDSDDKIGD